MISKITIVDCRTITISFHYKTLNDLSVIIEAIRSLNIFEDVLNLKETIEIVHSSDLTYDKILELINLLKTLSLIQENSIEYTLVNDAWTHLKSPKNILCGYKNMLNYDIQILNDSTISLLPINPEYNNISSNTIKVLLKKIELYNINYSVSTNCIKIFSSNKSITEIIKNLLTIFVEQHIIDAKDKTNIYNQAMLIFFQKTAKDEINNLQNINNKPVDHPLSRYQSISKDLESLLHKAVNGMPMDLIELNKLKNAITRTGEFTSIPEIITKNLSRLPKNIEVLLDKIITPH